MAKMLAAEASWAAAEACVQTHGGFGFAEEYDIERKFRETRLYQVAPISTNLILELPRRTRARPAAVLLMEECRKSRNASKAPKASCRIARRRDRTGGRRAVLQRAGSPTPARASSRSSAPRAISRAAMTMRRAGESELFRLAQSRQGIRGARSQRADGPARYSLAPRSRAPTCFVQNLKPGALARLGFAIDALRERPSGLIAARSAAMARSGPLCLAQGL